MVLSSTTGSSFKTTQSDSPAQLSSSLQFFNISPAKHPADTLKERTELAKTLKFSILPETFNHSLSLASSKRFYADEAKGKLTALEQQERFVCDITTQLENLRTRSLDPLALASTLPEHKTHSSKSSSLDWLNLETPRTRDLQLTVFNRNFEKEKLVDPQSQKELDLAADPTVQKVSRFKKALLWLKTPLHMLSQNSKCFLTTVALPKSTTLFMQKTYEGIELIKKAPLGKGVYGTVCTVSQGTTEYALKTINPTNQNAKKYLDREACMQMSLEDHPSLISLEAISPGELYLEKASKGSLDQRLKTKVPLTHEELKSYLNDVVSALISIHDSGKTYKDLKPGNILLDNSGHAKLCDFGLTVQTQDDYEYSGSCLYKAPEITHAWIQEAKFKGIIKTSISQAADVWSFGVMLYTIMTGGYFVLFHNNKETPQEYMTRLCSTLYGKPCDEHLLFDHLAKDNQALLQQYDDQSSTLKTLVIDCLHGDPQKRISMHEVQRRLSQYKPTSNHDKKSLFSHIYSLLQKKS